MENALTKTGKRPGEAAPARAAADKVRPATERRRGRPRAFDRTAALETATRLFWRHGYEGTSISALTAEMGITPPSLYNAFGSKAKLYAEALKHYRAARDRSRQAALDEEAGTLAAIERLLREAAAAFTRADEPPGCMVATALLGCAPEHEPVARDLAGHRRATLQAIEARIARGVAEGELAEDSDPAATARLVDALVQGLSVQARDGASEAELQATITVALDALARRSEQTRPRRGLWR